MNSNSLEAKTEFHRLLKRQIKKTFGKNPEIDESLRKLLALVNETYLHYEEDRKLLERAMNLSSDELLEANQNLLQQKNELNEAYEELKSTQQALEESQQIIKLTQELETQKQELEEANETILNSYEEIRQTQEELKKQNIALDKKNRDLSDTNQKINSSLKVAKLIQQAVLPYKEKQDTLLKDYFVINRPKDVVSGDFYWLNEVDGKIILIVADCTGHGVPGAFVTLIGANLLDKIVRVWDITNPAEILTQLHEEIQIVLRQKETGDKNGMDAVVISLEKENDDYKLIFAGAKNNIFIRNSEKLMELKGVRKSIGGIQNPNKQFENQELSLPIGSLLYLGSDGLEDQNNAKRKKFGLKKIRKFLEENYHLPLQEQRQMMDETLAQHMENTLQRDDILWMGIRLT